MARNPKSVRHLLKQRPSLRLLELEIAAQKALLDQVRALLPGELPAHCVAARRQGSRLVLHTDSPVWATRLRFLGPQLIALLRPDHPALREVRVRLSPPRNSRQRESGKPVKSAVAAAIIHDSARDTKQESLREALHRLGRALSPDS